MIRIDFSENHSDFPENFLEFRSDTIEKQGIINLSNINSRSYASRVISDTEVAFLEEGKVAASCSFLY